MVLEQPKSPPKPKKNTALADPWCGVDYVSSEDLGLHDDAPRRRAPTYESDHHHEKKCRCVDCRMFRWVQRRRDWQAFEATDGKLPAWPPYHPETEQQLAQWRRIRLRREAMSIARLRRVERWYATACKFRSYPPAAMIDNIFGDDETIVEFAEESNLSAHASTMEEASRLGVGGVESVGYHPDDESNEWNRRRATEMREQGQAGVDDAEAEREEWNGRRDSRFST